MASVIKLPDMGTNVQECKLLSWRVKEGDVVKRGEVLADIETDKAVAELESTAEGVLLKLVVNAGETAAVGDILAYVGMPGEAVGNRVETGAPAAAPSPAIATAGSSTLGGQDGPSARVSPIVRNLAAKLNVDLSRVKGTGAGGVITREDVQRASREPK
jgi:pyruvate/2-oxoglutarate dehydrogenase complex dihydrolipoamide acyltransferase (E2) component